MELFGIAFFLYFEVVAPGLSKVFLKTISAGPNYYAPVSSEANFAPA